MSKVGIFMADGCEEIEGLTVVDILRRGGIEVVMIALSDQKMVVGAHGITFLADAAKQEVNYDELSGIILPGGMPGTRNLAQDETVQEVIRDFAQKEKLVAAICAAPSVLGQAELLSGKKATCYPGFEEQLTGARYEASPVVRDGNIVTSRGMGTAIPFSLELLSYFKGEQTAAEMAKSIIY